jgi:hypothetical protein
MLAPRILLCSATNASAPREGAGLIQHSARLSYNRFSLTEGIVLITLKGVRCEFCWSKMSRARRAC